MAIVKPDLSQQWASDGDKIAPSGSKIQAGWGPEIPPYQWENWVQNRQDQMLAHINERGIPQWDSSTEYEGGKSYVQDSNGIIYVAIQSGRGQNPATSVAYWTPLEQRQIVVFDTPGVFPWTVPEILKLGGRKVKVTVVGGGGGGGYGGGSGGGTAIKLVDLAGVSTVTVTVGGGGSFSSTAPTAGGSSSFGSHCSAEGGFPGGVTDGPTSSGRPRGGTGIGGDVNITGRAGSPALRGSDGGDSFMGAAGLGSSNDAALAQNGHWPGGGGGGRNQFVTPGAGNGNGAAGGVIIEW